MINIAAAVELAERLAETARSTVLGYFRTGIAVDDKADASPVTRADRETEAAMRALIGEVFPDHGIFGEEYGAERMDADYVWVLDPIDGTKSFVIGKPLFGTLVALLHEGTPIIGVIEMAALGERWVGAVGRPTTMNGQPTRTRPCPSLADAWLSTTTPEMFANEDATAFARLRAGCRGAVYGADCYAYGLISLGSLDLVCEAQMKPYDYCALVPIVDGAGGRISDWCGRPLGLDSDGRVIAAGDPAAHARAVEALAG